MNESFPKLLLGIQKVANLSPLAARLNRKGISGFRSGLTSLPGQPSHLGGSALVASLLVVWMSATPPICSAQNPALRRIQQQQKEIKRRMDQAVKDAAANQPVLPSDPELLSLHREFITKAEKLAVEYERKKQYGKAREVFEAMSRLVPKYPEAEAGVKRMLQKQALEDRKIARVSASAGWQDSGAQLQKGMPVHVEVKGTWSVVLETGPEGVEIPNEIKPRDPRIKLGTLIGVIATSPSDLDKKKPFTIKSGADFVADQSGRLFLKMFDVDPSDNQGEMLVLIQSTFAN